MRENILTLKMIGTIKHHLVKEEKSEATVHSFCKYVKEQTITKALVKWMFEKQEGFILKV